MDAFYLNKIGSDDVQGPFTRDSLKNLIERGRLFNGYQVCRDGGNNWMPAAMWVRSEKAVVAVVAEPVQVVRPVKAVSRGGKIPVYRGEKAMKKKVTSSGALGGCLMFIASIICFGFGFMVPVLFPVALVILVGGFAVNKRKYVCPNCGNEVVKNSRLCPVCSTALK